MKIDFKKCKAIFFCFILFIILLFRDVFLISVNKYILVAFIDFSLLLFDSVSFKKSIFFILPLLYGLPGNYIVPFIVLLYFLKTKKVKKVQIFLMLFISLNEIISIVNFSNVSFSIINVVSSISFIGLFFLLLYDENSNKNDLIKYFIFGVFVLCLVVFVSNVFSITGDWVTAFENGWIRLGNITNTDTDLDSMRLKLNANGLAYYCIASISFCIFYFSKSCGIEKKILAILIIFFSIVGILTFSRTFILCYCLLIILLLFSNAKNFKETINKIIFLLVLLALVGVIINKSPFLLNGYISRFTDSNLNTAGGRTIIFSQYLDKFLNSCKSLLFGTGSINILDKMGMSYAIHNGFMQIILCYGLFGSIIFILFLLYPLKSRKKNNFKLIQCIPFIIVIVFIQTIQFINPYNLLFPYIIASYIINENDIKINESMLEVKNEKNINNNS